MTEPTTQEIRERHDSIFREDGHIVSTFDNYEMFREADIDRAILLKRLDAAEKENRRLKAQLKESPLNRDWDKLNNEVISLKEQLAEIGDNPDFGSMLGVISQRNSEIGELEAQLAEIEKDNLLSECESDWCGKTVLNGEPQKCHHCNVRAILNREKGDE